MPTFSHSYLPNIAKEKADMLAALGVNRIDELFEDIPTKFQLKDRVNIPPGAAETEVCRRVEEVLATNWNFSGGLQFLGGGVWQHLIPEALQAVIRRTEFVTAYTPYQAEISQGMLQALFEYQSLIAELVNLPIVNASMYDWASALGEAALMASRHTNRREVLVPDLMSRERLAVLKTYTQPADIIVKPLHCDMEQGSIDLDNLNDSVSNETAAVYIENPAYLGYLEPEVEAIADITHDSKALFVVGVDPISLGILRPPGDYKADIVVGEGQPLGSAVNMGGPLLGLFACRNDRKLLRQLPGRIIGLTTTVEGNQRGYVMTMQAREQHIRREKATSNICSNQALVAVTTAIYLSLMGPVGLRQIGEMILQLRNYAERQLAQIPGVQAPRFKGAHFKEFVMTLEANPKEQDKSQRIRDMLQQLQKKGILGGIPLDQKFPQLGESALVCVTEVQTKENIDQLVMAVQQVMGGT